MQFVDMVGCLPVRSYMYHATRAHAMNNVLYYHPLANTSPTKNHKKVSRTYNPDVHVCNCMAMCTILCCTIVTLARFCFFPCPMREARFCTKLSPSPRSRSNNAKQPKQQVKLAYNRTHEGEESPDQVVEEPPNPMQRRP